MLHQPIPTTRSRLVLHLERLLGSTDIGNGTSAAEALADALEADRRASAAPERELLELDAGRAARALADLRAALGGGPRSFRLPFGSVAEVSHGGTVRIAGRPYLLDAGVPGLHPAETVPKDADGPNLRRLREVVHALTRGTPLHRFGLPEPAFVADCPAGYLLRFAPLAEASGVVVQTSVRTVRADRFRSASAGRIGRMASEIVDGLMDVWTERAALGLRVAEVRHAAEAGLVREFGVNSGMRLTLVALDLERHQGTGAPTLDLQYHALDPALRPGAATCVARFDDRTGIGIIEPPRSIRRRMDERARLRAAGADGRIDDVAAAVVLAAPGGAAPILRQLADGHRADVVFPRETSPIHAVLHWDDGVIRAAMSKDGDLDWHDGMLEVRGVLPETVVAAAPERGLHEIVGLPFPWRSRIVEMEARGDGWLRIWPEVGTSLVDLATGRIWAEPPWADRDRMV